MTLIALITTLVLQAQIPETPKTSDAWVLIVDPGAELFTRFGHSAFLIRHPNGDETVYDFGVFDFNSSFAIRFIKGEAKYYLEKRDLNEFMDGYMREERTVRGHLLNLSNKKVEELEATLESIYNSDERYYRYHHFANNCATQMLGILSRLFKGDVQNSLEKIPIVPWRTNLGRVLGEWTMLNWGLRFILSSELDAKRSAWTGSFLPYLLEQSLQSITVSEDPFAKKQPLVAKSVVFFKGVNHAKRLSRPWWFYLTAIFFLVLFLLPFLFNRRSVMLKVVMGVYSILVLVLFSILFFLHLHLDICAYNLNMVAYFPFLLIALPFLGGDHIYTRRGMWAIAISASFPLLAIFLRFFTIQQTSPFPELAFVVHIAFFGEWWLITSLKRRREQALATAANPTTLRPVQTDAHKGESAVPAPSDTSTPAPDGEHENDSPA